LDWGFEQELEAVRYCRAVFESADYKKGYEWAIKQNKDYLLQHFGLYFDEWNEKGLGGCHEKNLIGFTMRPVSLQALSIGPKSKSKGM
jgi:hypothetical protein